ARRTRRPRRTPRTSWRRRTQAAGSAATARPTTGPWPLRLSVPEAVSDAADREQVLRVLWVVLELLAQVADVDVDRARVAVGGVCPDPVEQHVAREDPPGGAGQGRQDLELDKGQLGLVASHLDRALQEVETQIAELQRRLIGSGQDRPRQLCAPQR